MAETTDTSVPKKPAPQLETLKVYEGEWVIEGENYGGAPADSNSRVTGKMTNEWLKGNFFMSTRWEYQFATAQHIGAGFLGFDDKAENFFVRNFDNMGYERLYEISLYKNTWTFTGEKERATMVFNDDKTSYEEEWEILKDNSWQPLCKRTGKKVK